MFHSDTKEQNDNTHQSMEEPQKYEAKRKIPNTPEKAEFEGEVGESAWVMGLVCLECGGSYTPVCNY